MKANPDPKEPPFIAVSGEYEYPNPEGGAPIKVKYTADEHGFHPEVSTDFYNHFCYDYKTNIYKYLLLF